MASLKLFATQLPGTTEIPVTIISNRGIADIRKLMDSLGADFPGATSHMPAILTNTENGRVTRASSALVLNKEIRKALGRNGVIAVANGVVSVLTLL